MYWAYHDKRRPVIIISRRSLNQGDRVVVVPLTSSRLEERRKLRNCVSLNPHKHGVPKECVAQTDAIAVIHVQDLIFDEGPIATLDGETMRELIRAVGYVIEAECEPA